jgi:predicted DNA-binding protein
MMAKKPKSPDEIAKEKYSKKTYSFSLIEKNVETIKQMAAASEVPSSELVDEAIKAYIEAMNEKK